MHEIQGFAWSGNGTIRAVDVTVDGGATWREATLDRPVLDKCLTGFRFPWNWAGGPATIASRAVDSTGYVQPTVQDIAKVRAIAGFVQHNNGVFPMVRQRRWGGQKCDRLNWLWASAAVIVATGCATPQIEAPAPNPRVKFGTPISNADIAAWDIDIRTTDGKGLPAGRGSVAEGKSGL